MNVELVAQMFKNYQSNVLFHLEGLRFLVFTWLTILTSGSQQRTISSRHHRADRDAQDVLQCGVVILDGGGRIPDAGPQRAMIARTSHIFNKFHGFLTYVVWTQLLVYTS